MGNTRMNLNKPVRVYIHKFMPTNLLPIDHEFYIRQFYWTASNNLVSILQKRMNNTPHKMHMNILSNGSRKEFESSLAVYHTRKGDYRSERGHTLSIGQERIRSVSIVMQVLKSNEVYPVSIWLMDKNAQNAIVDQADVSKW